VIDTGKGIPADSTYLLFRKFQQASNNILTRDSTRSSGLGLYISRLIMNGMDGQIELLESGVDKGSTFRVTIPLASKTEAAA
jgi:signal transduction histidine kinase